MVQPSSGAGDPAQRATTPPERGGAGTRSRALPRVQALIEKGRGRGASRNTSWWESLLESLRALTRPPVLRHAIAALERGNLDAAFALLREEVKTRPGQAESALLFWNAAVSVDRAGEAAEAMARLIRSETASDDGLEQAANHWTALVNAVPEAVVDVSALAKLVPLLRARSERARGDAAKTEALALFVDTLRRCVDPSHGPLNPALALRLVEEARGVDAQVARAAAQVALTSSGLHEAKRAKLEELLASLERGEWPDATAVATPVAAPARPVAAAPTPVPRATPKAAAHKTAPAPRPAPAPAPAPAARVARPRPAPGVPPEEKSAPGGRRTVALTQDEIEAASSRLAERMAARSAAPSPSRAPVAAEPVLDASDMLEVDDEPLEKDEPIAILEQDDAVAILEEDGANAILEVDAEEEPPQGDEPVAMLENTNPELDEASAEFEFGGAAAATGPGGELEAVDATLDEGDAPSADFAFGEPVDDAQVDDDEFAFGAEPEDAASDADFEIGSADVEAGEDLADIAEADLAEDADPLDATIAGATFEEAPIEDVPIEVTPAADAPTPALRAIDILPVEIGADGFVAYEVAQAQRTRIDYRAVEAIAAAEVTDLADEPILVALLVLRARAGRPRSALRMRCDTFDPASLFPDQADSGQALRAMLSDLLERTRAIPLPDPDSALAIQPQQFESLAAFEEAVLARLAC